MPIESSVKGIAHYSIGDNAGNTITENKLMEVNWYLFPGIMPGSMLALCQHNI